MAPPPYKLPASVNRNIMLASQRLVAQTQQGTSGQMTLELSNNSGTPPLPNLSAAQTPAADDDIALEPPKLGEFSQMVAGSGVEIDFDVWDPFLANPFPDPFNNDGT
jgi:hypothetical protein